MAFNWPSALSKISDDDNARIEYIAKRSATGRAKPGTRLFRDLKERTAGALILANDVCPIDFSYLESCSDRMLTKNICGILENLDVVKGEFIGGYVPPCATANLYVTPTSPTLSEQASKARDAAFDKTHDEPGFAPQIDPR